jgi:hypothetical protein
MKLSKIKEIRHYSVVKNWKKIQDNIYHPDAQSILEHDFNKYTQGRWGLRFELGEFPGIYDDCGWQIGRRGRTPEYFQYVKPGACHWLVNFYLTVAMLTTPSKDWRILTSDEHSTVWDGQKTVFDPNFLAIGVSAPETYKMARFGGEELAVGEYLEVGYPMQFELTYPELRKRKQEWKKILKDDDQAA